MKLYKIILPLFALVALAACTSECFSPNKVLAGVRFYNAQTKKSLTISKMYVKGVGSDSMLYNGVSGSDIFLPLHIDDSSTSFEVVLNGDSSRIFTMSFTHIPYPQYISKECGCAVYQTIENVTFVSSDSLPAVELVNPEVENTNGDINVQVYL